MATLFTSELEEGMVTLTDTYSNSGKLIVPKDTVLTKSELQRPQCVAVDNAVGALPVARINGNNRAFFTHKYDLPNS